MSIAIRGLTLFGTYSMNDGRLVADRWARRGNPERNSRRAFVRNALLGLIHRTTQPGPLWSVWMMTPLRGEPAPALSRSSSGGDQGLGNSSVSSQRSHGTTGSKADSGSRATHRSTPTRSHPGDLDGKYGVQASATVFEAIPLGPNPSPGDPTLGTLSQDRSARS